MCNLFKEYWDDIGNTDELERGVYILLPLRYKGKCGEIKVKHAKREEFKSSDFTEVLQEKCCRGDYVKRYIINDSFSHIMINDKIQILDMQLFVFNNGIAFLAVFLSYKNEDVHDVYDFFNPGYFSENDIILEKQKKFIEAIYEEVFGDNKEFSWYVKQEATYIIKEAYRMNVAKVNKRFKEIEIINQITYNQHRMINLTKVFSDLSEKDVGYTSSARDVDDEHYGWGCCITSQEISYTYNTKNLLTRAQEDLLLTILVMHQRYTCFILNEEIHKRYMEETHDKTIQELKTDALEFIAYGTLAPSQISRWSNVCDTYEQLIKRNGIDETLEEIQQKIALLNEEQEKINSKREETVSSIIAVFGLISIIAAVLQVVDYVVNGGMIMMTWLVISLGTIIIISLNLVVVRLKKHKKRGDL